MKQPDEIKIAWAIWILLSHLNEILWDRYEEEFLEIIADPREMQQIDQLVGNLKAF